MKLDNVFTGDDLTLDRLDDTLGGKRGSGCLGILGLIERLWGRSVLKWKM